MKRHVLWILLSAILIVFICIIFNEIRINNIKRNTISPNLIQINKVDFVDNKFSLSGYVIGNSTYGDYTGYKYVVKKISYILCFMQMI